MNKKQRQSMLICRACLVRDCKMFDIHEHKAAAAFAHITDTPVSRDRLPQQLCGWCLMLVHKYASFREMCVRTQQRLTGVRTMDSDGPQTPPLRSFHLSKTDMIVINCVPPERNIIYKPRQEPPEPDDVLIDDNINPDPKIKYEIEHTNEIENSFSINDINVNSKTQTETTVKENMGDENDDQFFDGEDPLKNIEVETCDPNAEVLMDFIMEPVPKTELDYEEDKISIHENEIGYLLNLDDNKDVSNIKNNHTRDSDDDEMDTNSVDAVDNNVNPEKEDESYKIKERISEGNKNKEDFKDGDESHDNVKNVSEDKVCGKQVKPVKGRRKKEKVKKEEVKRIWDDFASFESANEVKVVVLSKEEQLEEIVSRKKSRNYLESPFKCEECGRGYLYETAYTNHRTKQHNASMKHACDICGLRFKHGHTRNAHHEVHRLKFLCNLCKFVARNRHKAKTHHEMHEGKTFECQQCGQSFEKKDAYYSHVRVAHPGHNVVCRECGETFFTNKGLQHHMKRTHSESFKPQFKCSTCSANFASVEALNRHMDTAGDHADLRPCEQCGENCASEDALQEHIKEKHRTESHHCEKCDTTFASSAAYDTHHRLKHLEQQLQRERNHFSGSCVCDQCGYKAKNSSLLEYHMRSHLAVKPFACAHCPKSYVTKAMLRWHMRTHTGEKPYKCNKCALAFSIKNNFQRHYRTIHLRQYNSFLCEICARAFTTKDMMKLHVKTIHEGMPWPKRIRKPRGKGTKPAVDNK